MTRINSYNNNRLYLFLFCAGGILCYTSISCFWTSIFIFLLYSRFLFCKVCSIHLCKIFRVKETERDKSPTTLAFPWLKESVREWQIHNIIHFHQFLFYTCYVSTIPCVYLKCLNKIHWQPSAIDFIFIALH